MCQGCIWGIYVDIYIYICIHIHTYACAYVAAKLRVHTVHTSLGLEVRWFQCLDGSGRAAVLHTSG